MTTGRSWEVRLGGKLRFFSRAGNDVAGLQGKGDKQETRFGEISLDFRKMQMLRLNQPVSLTFQEFKVLKFLVTRPELVISRQKLISALWSKKKRATHRVVDNQIARLRQKIEADPAHPVFLRTVRGVGYKFVPGEQPRERQEEFSKHEETELSKK